MNAGNKRKEKQMIDFRFADENDDVLSLIGYFVFCVCNYMLLVELNTWKKI